MSSSRLLLEQLSCKPDKVKHMSDQLTINTKFLVDGPDVRLSIWQLYENAKWKILNSCVEDHFAIIENTGTVINFVKNTTNLTKVVIEGIELSVPIANLSNYNRK